MMEHSVHRLCHELHFAYFLAEGAMGNAEVKEGCNDRGCSCDK